jgi:hypothetical protein
MPKRGTFSCPANYGSKEARKDKDRLHHFYCKRISPPSCGGGALSETEDAEEAQLTARVAAFEESPEGRARSRIFERAFLPADSATPRPKNLRACERSTLICRPIPMTRCMKRSRPTGEQQPSSVKR